MAPQRVFSVSTYLSAAANGILYLIYLSYRIVKTTVCMFCEINVVSSVLHDPGTMDVFMGMRP